jgi:hypothetical protein
MSNYRMRHAIIASAIVVLLAWGRHHRFVDGYASPAAAIKTSNAETTRLDKIRSFATSERVRVGSSSSRRRRKTSSRARPSLWQGDQEAGAEAAGAPNSGPEPGYAGPPAGRAEEAPQPVRAGDCAGRNDDGVAGHLRAAIKIPAATATAKAPGAGAWAASTRFFRFSSRSASNSSIKEFSRDIIAPSRTSGAATSLDFSFSVSFNCLLTVLWRPSCAP